MTQPSTHRALALLLAAASILPAALALAQQPLTFEVATIKPHGQGALWRLQPTPDGYTASNVSLLKLVGEAYGIFDPKLITGGPRWIDTDKFDLEAKFDTASNPHAKDVTYRQRADMLQPLLADRFHLKVHFATKDFAVYNLVLAKGGAKLQEAKAAPSSDQNAPPVGTGCLIQRQRAGITQRRDCPVTSLDDLLRYETGRTVIDKTGLTGLYDFELQWTPDDTRADSPIASGPSIFTALQEQLGLKLEPATAPLSVLVIDSAEHPSAN
jgi:uncharacterized protein (TIGR03435 family)